MSETTLPPDDPTRLLTISDPDEPGRAHLSVLGDTYTVLVSGQQTAGRYCLIEMYVPPGGGPPLHRHDFEEAFTMLEGQIDVTFRGETVTLKTGQTANIPANAPHHFTNPGPEPARMLCYCSPAGLEEFFAAFAPHVPHRTASAPPPEPGEMEGIVAQVKALAPRYRTEML